MVIQLPLSSVYLLQFTSCPLAALTFFPVSNWWKQMSISSVSPSQNIESRLKVSLPSDLGAALTDGVVLCHLANHVRPRSVPSIHVPSPAVVSIQWAAFWLLAKIGTSYTFSIFIYPTFPLERSSVWL